MLGPRSRALTLVGRFVKSLSSQHVYAYMCYQVWGSTTPASKRNASISSAASVNDLSPSQGENAYRSNLGESWTAPRPSSGTWDELSGSPQKKEFSQLVSKAMVS